MKKAFGDYKRLRHGAGGSLWEGPDHLLVIETHGFFLPFTEQYRRIDYAKIQCITLARTKTWGWLTVTSAIVSLLLGWGLLASIRNDFTPGIVMTSIVLAPFAMLLLINLIKGPTAVCEVQTAVQALRLRPVKRLRAGKAVVSRLAELCRQHQGDSPVSLDGLAAYAPVASPGIKPPYTRLASVVWAVALALISGLFSIGELFIDNLATFSLDYMIGVAAVACLITGLARGMRYHLPGALKASLWGGLATFIFSGVVDYGLFIFASATLAREAIEQKKLDTLGDETAMLRWMSHAGFDELQWAAWIVIGVGGIKALLALIGLPAALHRDAADSTVAPPPMAARTSVQPAANEPAPADTPSDPNPPAES